jgi:type III secretion protein R
MTEIPNLIVLFVGLSLLPLMVVACTSFLKIAVVLLITRNALGLQQVPPNIVVYCIAFATTIFIMAPVLQPLGQWINMSEFPNQLTAKSNNSIPGLVNELSEPMKVFMVKHTRPALQEMLLESAAKLWPENMRTEISKNHWALVLPSFVLSELQSAFEIGFLIYLPFVAIDLLVANLLLALGMQMVSPMVISTPLKLLLFIVINGWTNLLSKLMLTYQ